MIRNSWLSLYDKGVKNHFALTYSIEPEFFDEDIVNAPSRVAYVQFRHAHRAVLIRGSGIIAKLLQVPVFCIPIPKSCIVHNHVVQGTLRRVSPKPVDVKIPT